MQNLFKSLPFRLLVALIVGILLGLVANEAVMTFIVPVHYILGQFVNFMVPLIILGFIAPAIVTMGSNASRMLGVALLVAYCSSVMAAILTMFAGFGIIPNLHIASEVAGLKELPKMVFQLNIPQVMPVMTALVTAVLIGLATAWTKAKTWAHLLEELQQIVLTIVTHILIPVLPVFIATTFMKLSYQGVLTKQFPVFLKIIVIVMLCHYIWMGVLYFVAGLYAKKSGWDVLKNYGAAYLTAVGTMSSAATLPVALRGAHASCPPLQDDVVDFCIPLFANVHMPGSVLTETFFVMTISQILYGEMPSMGKMIAFCMLLAIFGVAAPGVPGGTVMASLGLITGLLGFDDNGTGMILAIFALQDSFGTACNVTGDGALTLIMTRYAQKHHLKAAEPIED